MDITLICTIYLTCRKLILGGEEGRKLESISISTDGFSQLCHLNCILDLKGPLRGTHETSMAHPVSKVSLVLKGVLKLYNPVKAFIFHSN